MIKGNQTDCLPFLSDFCSLGLLHSHTLYFVFSVKFKPIHFSYDVSQKELATLISDIAPTLIYIFPYIHQAHIYISLKCNVGVESHVLGQGKGRWTEGGALLTAWFNYLVSVSLGHAVAPQCSRTDIAQRHERQ
jgi:hypothetical protein